MKTFKEIREQQEQIKAKMAKMKNLVKPKLDIKGKLKKILGKLPGADAAKKLAEADPIGFKEGKYLKYSDLLLAKSRLMDKEGPNSPAMKKIDKAIAKEMKKLGIEGIWVKEANNKTAFLQRVMPRFPGLDKKLGKDAWDRIVQVVKPKNNINSKRYVELGNIFDTGNYAKMLKALKTMEKKDGIK